MRCSSVLPIAASIALVGVADVPSAQTAPLTIRPITSVGCEACTDARHIAKVIDVDVNAQGEFLVVDGEAPTLRLFGRDGRPLRSFGRSGRGPGEYVFPMRAAFGPGGSIHVLDLSARRITHLTGDGDVTSTVPLGVFPGAVSSRGESGELYVLSDDFHGTLTVMRFAPDAVTPVVVTRIDHPPRPDGVISIPGIAVDERGDVALARDNEQYRIARLSRDGTWLSELVRDIPRVARTPEEQADLDRQLKRVGSMAAAEKGQSKAPRPLVGTNPADLTLKPHFSFSGLRYDDGGRLWILTNRGTGSESVFDLFSPQGGFVGALRVPAGVNTYAVRGSFLVTAGERDDGTPVVTLWSVQPSR
jgi:hypothetical protein